MSVALFDPDEIMRAVRAATGLSPPAKVANPLKSRPDLSKLAELAASPDWRARLRGLPSTPSPDGFSPGRWAAVLDGAERFARDWAVKAMSLGWGFEELFTLRAPFANVFLQGAAWFVGDSTITAVTADAITLRTEGGAIQRIYRKQSA
jgi:hypothetical protein